MTTEQEDHERERAEGRQTILDQREANQRLVIATMRADEATERAEAAQQAAEAAASELRAVAELRELFVGILGHDLRNPLGSIIMAAGVLIERGNLTDEDANTVGRILTSGQRMARLIAQILELTRIRLGEGLSLRCQPADLEEICRGVVGELEGVGDVRIEVEGDVTGTWDADRLAQVLSNLAGNALEHASPGTAVEVKARADGAEWVIVEVSNQGDPIPPELLPRLFEPFRRGKMGERSKDGHLGLGLYIAREVVRAHGGTLDARSTGGNTTFTVRLPRSYNSEKKAPARKAGAASRRRPGGPLPGER